MRRYVSVLDTNPPKLKVHQNSGGFYESTLTEVFELPFQVPHVLVAERWVDAFKIEPFYEHVKDDYTDPYFSIGEEGVCEECKDWCTVGKNNSPEVLTEEQLTRLQKMGRLCSERCALEYVFGFRGGPSIQTVKQNIDAYTSVSTY